MEHYINTYILHQLNGSYTVRFPWKEDHQLLPTNYFTCTRRLPTLLYKLKALFATYSKILADQEWCGFTKKVQQPTNTDNCHYIPYHAIRNDSPTTPLWIVYDCSCHQSKSLLSLNYYLLSGDPQLNDLYSIILQFRIHKYEISIDIEKAFLQVHLNQKNHDYTRFLWPAKPTQL